MAYRLVVIGTSWGGLHALSTLLAGLPRDFPGAIVLVQHRSRESDSLLASLLQAHSRLPVAEVEDKEPIEGGRVFLAAADYHLLVETDHFSLTTDPHVRYSRPSIDVTFMSAADSFATDVVGVVLTGANDDGARGLRRIADRGGYPIVQQPESAESPAMPAAARKAVPEAHVLALDAIAAHLTTLFPAARASVHGGR